MSDYPWKDAEEAERAAHKALTKDQYDRACSILLAEIPERTWNDVIAMIAIAPSDWIHQGMQHFGWGMAVRNLLRSKGFTDEESLTHNLDDIYIPLVEEAARRSKASRP